MLYPSGTPTQPEIITIALSKLSMKPTDTFADIGCGSGSVSIRSSPYVKKVYAIDNRDEAIHATSKNIEECGAGNITILKGEASTLLCDLEIDCAFVGGSKNMENILSILMDKVSQFVVSAVKIETVALVLKILRNNEKFKELIQIQLSRGNELGGGIMLMPENPVFLIVGGI